MYTLMDFFRETISRPLGVLLPEIFTHAGDWQRLTSTHPKGDGCPPQKKSWKLKICLKVIQRARVHNFRNSGSIFTKLFHATCRYCERNFVFLNWFCTRTWDAGRPHVWLCHARLVESNTLNFKPDFLFSRLNFFRRDPRPRWGVR